MAKERRSRSASFVLVSCCCSNYEMSNGTVIKRPSSIHQRPSTSVRLFAKNEINHRRLFALAFKKKKKKKKKEKEIGLQSAFLRFSSSKKDISLIRTGEQGNFPYVFFHELFYFVPCRRPRELPDRKGIGTTLFQFCQQNLSAIIVQRVWWIREKEARRRVVDNARRFKSRLPRNRSAFVREEGSKIDSKQISNEIN